MTDLTTDELRKLLDDAREAFDKMEHFAVVLKEADGRFVSVKQRHYEALRAAISRETVAPDNQVAALKLLLARNLVMDLGSGEDGAEALGGMGKVMDMVAAYREENPLPEVGGDEF